MKRKFISRNVLLTVALILFAGMGLSSIASTNNKIQLKEVQLKDKSAELKQLDLKYDKLNVELDTVDKTKTEEIKKLEVEKAELQKQKGELEKQVQAKREAQRIAAEKASKAVKTVSATVAPKVSAKTSKPSTGYCGDNKYKQYIYMKESGCRTNARNPIGCYGIGQSCPASKIAHCGDDFACQDAWFSNYAQQRYGGWAGAYSFWLKNHWW